MSSLVPNRFLFKFEFPLHRAHRPMAVDGHPAAWGERHRLPRLGEIDGRPGFGEIYAAWDETGLYVGCRVEGKARPLSCDPARFRQSDCLRLMTDMRDTRDIRRATRFCQQFYFLPTGGGPRGRDAVAGAAKVSRATQDAPLAPSKALRAASAVNRRGYELTAHVAAGALVGCDPQDWIARASKPAERARIGFFVMLEDTELGQQSLTVGDDLNWWIDPSTWPTAVLAD